tara:strand:+ start:114 stop:299 length:186 start_codon:yes stop_codon:yes gene_type:complete
MQVREGTVKELIKLLKKCPKDLPVRLDNGDMENYWLTDIEWHDTGASGYEVCGEITLIGKE